MNTVMLIIAVSMFVITINLVIIGLKVKSISSRLERLEDQALETDGYFW